MIEHQVKRTSASHHKAIVPQQYILVCYHRSQVRDVLYSANQTSKKTTHFIIPLQHNRNWTEKKYKIRTKKKTMGLIGAVVISLVSILTIVYAHFKHAYGYWRSRGISYDEPEFPFGNIKGFGKTAHQSQLIKDIYDKHKSSDAKFGGIYFFAGPGVILMDPDLIKRVLVKDIANFNERGVYYNEEDDPISAHLFSVDGEKWKKLRAKLTTTFSSSKMKFMFSTVVEVGERFKDCLIDVVKQNSDLEIRDLMARFTTDVIGTCAFGIECNSLNDPNAEFRQYGSAVFGKPRHHPLIAVMLAGFRNFARKLHIKIIRDDVSEFFMKVVRDTVEYR